MARRKISKKEIPKKYIILDRELAEVCESVSDGNPLLYGNQYGLLSDKYFSRVGEDINIDFNIAFAHLSIAPTRDFKHLFEKKPKEILEIPNSRLKKVLDYGMIDRFLDPVSVSVGFGYLEELYVHNKENYSKGIESSCSKFMMDYITQSIHQREGVARVNLSKGMLSDTVQIIRARKYVDFWDKIICCR